MTKRVMVLGATGSIGGSVLSVLRENPDRFRVVGLVAGRPSEKLAALCREFPAAAVAVGDDRAGWDIPGMREAPVQRFTGPDGPLELVNAVAADICVAAVSGTAGMELAFAAAARGMRILLANKEVLVSAGRLFLDAARAGGSEVLPLDSEHAALWQCLEGKRREDVAKLVITASGGPFRQWPDESIALATPDDALRHPVWRMGRKISIDSATLANKALELIEAHHLFGFPFDRMEVLVHPQSAVHGMAEFADGTIIASLGACDMRLPAAYMLFYPERRQNALPRLDLAHVARLDFEPPRHASFPLLRLGSEAGRRGGAYPALFNAANEAAVQLFLAGRLNFPGMAAAVEAALSAGADGEPEDVAAVRAVHRLAAARVEEFANIHARGAMPRTPA